MWRNIFGGDGRADSITKKLLPPERGWQEPVVCDDGYNLIFIALLPMRTM